MQSMVQSAKKVYTVIFTAQWAITFLKRLENLMLNLFIKFKFFNCV